LNNTTKQQQQIEQQNAMREQVVINTRILALKHASRLMSMRDPATRTVSAADLVNDAEAIATYLTKDIQAIKPKSALVVTSQMPPPAAGFKPGD